jgi:hypothetical protein
VPCEGSTQRQHSGRHSSLILPSFAGATDQPEKTVPQGQDPPGADGQQAPPSTDKEVIPPPPVGDEDIYTDAPNPQAGHEEEVIPSITCARGRAERHASLRS